MANVILNINECSTPLALRLLWDNESNVPVSNINSVNDWNTFFGFDSNPTLYTNIFTSVIVNGTSPCEILLLGGSNITLKEYLFGDCDNGYNLLEVEDFADCVIACANGVFSDTGVVQNGCYNLTKIHLPVCSSLAEDVFMDCNLLNDLIIDYNSITVLNNRLFYGCTSLTSIIFPNVITANNSIFYYCTSLTILQIPLLTSALVDFCDHCESLLSISFPDLVSIGGNSFSSCYSLASIYLPLLENAGYNLIIHNPLLINIFLPSLITLGDYGFSNCLLLNSVDCPLLESIGTGCFKDSLNIETIYTPSLLNMGGDVGLNNVFENIIGKIITLTIPSALMTCNSGQPDEDIQVLNANNTLTVIQI